MLKNTYACFGYQQLTGLNTAKSLTIPAAANGVNPTQVRINCGTQAVRWRDDGTAPTATVGMRLPVGIDLIYDGDLTKIQFIEETASAQLNISYYG